MPGGRSALRPAIGHRDYGTLVVRGSRVRLGPNNGVGIPPQQLATLFKESQRPLPHEGSGIALKNVNARLSALFGPEHALQVASARGEGTTVSFSVPCCVS